MKKGMNAGCRKQPVAVRLHIRNGLDKSILFASRHSVEDVLERFNAGYGFSSWKTRIGNTLRKKGDPQKKTEYLKQIAEVLRNHFTIILLCLVMLLFCPDPLFPGTGWAGRIMTGADWPVALPLFAIPAFFGILHISQTYRPRNPRTSTHIHNESAAQTMPANEPIAGDILRLASGDVEPADLRIVENGLFVNQYSVTGDDAPAEKTADAVPHCPEKITPATVAAPANIPFAGSGIISGSAVDIVIAHGADTLNRAMAFPNRSKRASVPGFPFPQDGGERAPAKNKEAFS